jgi:hypothetical protein
MIRSQEDLSSTTDGPPLSPVVVVEMMIMDEVHPKGPPSLSCHMRRE